MDKFLRSENVKRYRKMLDRVTDDEQRRQLLNLLAEEEQKQIEAGDFDSVPSKQAS